jgi:methylase of polypeptide subunit release factors
MKIAEALAKYKEENEHLGAKLCKVGWWITELDEEDKKEVEALMFDTPLTSKEVMGFLNSINVIFSVETIRKHRMKECICLQQRA